METETNWKYIVYCTTNTENGKIYVGVHKTENPEIFDGYIGCGCYINQPHTYENPKTAFQFAVKKHGPHVFKRSTIQIFDTDTEASDLEELIVDEKFIKRTDVYNMILGGLNNIGESNKIKVFQYNTNGQFLCGYDSYNDAGLAMNVHWSSIYLAVKRKGTCKNYFWSTDKLTNLDLSLYTHKNKTKIPIFLYNISGEYLKTFSSISDCSDFINVSVSETSHAAYMGYKLRNKYYVCFEYNEKYDIARKNYTKHRKVFKYNKDGILIKMYESQFEAEAENKGSNIDKFIKNKSLDKNGFYWRLFECDNLATCKKPGNSIPVYKYDLKHNLVCTYKSKTSAEKENGCGIWAVIDKPDRTHKNHIYTTKPIKDIV